MVGTKSIEFQTKVIEGLCYVRYVFNFVLLITYSKLCDYEQRQYIRYTLDNVTNLDQYMCNIIQTNLTLYFY
jgi:hypothetical protein